MSQTERTFPSSLTLFLRNKLSEHALRYKITQELKASFPGHSFLNYSLQATLVLGLNLAALPFYHSSFKSLNLTFLRKAVLSAHLLSGFILFSEVFLVHSLFLRKTIDPTNAIKVESLSL